ncbi:hypothetical protein M0804_004200 [Polistes exclamans]|nr:hypothetical protein M0804_004200 [Polistes exclamans]
MLSLLQRVQKEEKHPLDLAHTTIHGTIIDGDRPLAASSTALSGVQRAGCSKSNEEEPRAIRERRPGEFVFINGALENFPADGERHLDYSQEEGGSCDYCTFVTKSRSSPDFQRHNRISRIDVRGRRIANYPSHGCWNLRSLSSPVVRREWRR